MYPEHRLERYDPDFPRDIILWVKEYYNRELLRDITPLKLVSTKESYLLSKYYKSKYNNREYNRKMVFTKEKILLFILGCIFVFVFVFRPYSIIIILDLIPKSLDHPLLLASIVVFTFYFFALLAVGLDKTYRKIQMGRKYDFDLFGMTQRTIDYAREYFKRNDINPRDFPMELAFNDYQGLTYEKKGRRYLAFIKVD